MNETQKEWVKETLKREGFITRNQCLSRVPAITRLSAIILALKDDGMDITGKWDTFHEKKDYIYKLQKKEPVDWYDLDEKTRRT